MSHADREAWLIDHAYEETDKGWVLRADLADTPTVQRIERALTATEGTRTFLIEPLLDELEGDFVEGDPSSVRNWTRPFYVAVVLLAVALIVAVMWAVAADLFGDDDGSAPSSSAPVVSTGDSGADDVIDPSDDHDTGDDTDEVDDEPAALTEGTWRFFLTSDEATALYDFAFVDDGTFHEDDASHNHGTYVVDGATITMQLTRVHTVVASDGVNERSAEVTWNETFTMARTGDSMTGTWIQDDWRFTLDEGFVPEGRFEPQVGIFARPERPEDPG